MPDEPNRLVLEGTIGPPTVTQTRTGAITSRTYLSIPGPPRFTILIRGAGTEAARLTDTPAGATIRVLGSLAWDTGSRRIVVDVIDLKHIASPPTYRATLHEAIKDALPYST